jgi:hypothetical protein
MSFEALKKLRSSQLALQLCTESLDEFNGIWGRAYDAICTGGSNNSDRMAGIITRRDTVRNEITKRLDQYTLMIKQAMDELAAVENGEFLAILRLRFVCDCSWPDIARKLGERLTADAVKKRFQRYLEEYESKTNSVA